MDKFLNFENGIIRYVDVGENTDCIVFLHGFTESIEIWDNFIEELKDKYRIIAIDLPGHGKTSSYSNVHSMSFMAKIVKYVLDQLKIKKILLIGHSMGGYVSLEFASLYPDLLKGVGLFHSQAAADTQEEKDNRDRVIKIVKENKVSFLNNFIPDLFSIENRKKLIKKIDELKNYANMYMTTSGLIAALTGMKTRNSHLETIAKLKVPLFYILGKQDNRIPFSKALAQIELSSECWVEILNTGHMGYIEEPHKTLAFITKFS